MRPSGPVSAGVRGRLVGMGASGSHEPWAWAGPEPMKPATSANSAVEILVVLCLRMWMLSSVLVLTKGRNISEMEDSTHPRETICRAWEAGVTRLRGARSRRIQGRGGDGCTRRYLAWLSLA